MQVKIDAIGTLGRKVSVMIPAEEIDAKVTNELQTLAQSANIKGFRPGKVPLNIIKQRFGNDVRQDVVSKQVNQSLQKIFEENQFEPVAQPEVSSYSAEAGKPIEVTLEFEIFPEVTFDENKLKEVELQKEIYEIDDKDIEDQIQKMKRMLANWHTSESVAKLGDMLIMDLKITFSGKDIKPLEDAEYKTVLGDKEWTEAFDQALTGVKSGDKKSFEINLPKDFENKEYAGHKAEFNCLIKEIKEPNLPSDEVLFNHITKRPSEEYSKEELMKAVKNTTEKLALQVANRKIEKELMDKLMDIFPIELPQMLIEREVKRFNQMRHQHDHEHQHDENCNHEHEHSHALDKDKIDPEVLKNVKTQVHFFVLMHGLKKKFNIEVDMEMVKSKILELSQLGVDPQMLSKMLSKDSAQYQQFISTILEKQIIEKLLQYTNIKEVKKPFDEFEKNILI